eukprot:scaffold13223_cov61-Phaeocystis_antarctica.AAC.3
MARGATSDVLCSAVLARRAVDTGTAVAVGVAVELVLAPVQPVPAGITDLKAVLAGQQNRHGSMRQERRIGAAQGGTDQLSSQLEPEPGEGGGNGEGGGGGAAHVSDVMVPSELQTCVPVPARARMHRRLVCDGASWRERFCGAGAAARRSGVGWSGGSATARGATSDVLAALYWP